MDSTVIIKFHKIAKRNQRNQLIWASGLFSLGLVLAFSPLMPSGAGSIFWYWFGLIFCVLAALLALYSLRIFPFSRKSITRYLQEDPHEIVWVYPYIVENMPYGIKLFNLTTLYLMLKNGNNLQLRCKPEEANQLMDELKPHLTHASFGYSQEKEFMYENDPKMLIKKN